MAAHSDGLLLMNYDQHQTDSGPGPIAPEDWFVKNLQNIMSEVPKEKLICAIGSYGYDWTMTSAASTCSREEGRAREELPPPLCRKVVHAGQHVDPGSLAGCGRFRV